MIVIPNKIDKKVIAELPKVVFPGRIYVIYTEADARKAVAYLNSHALVGVDTETRPSFRKGMVNQVALLQVATETGRIPARETGWNFRIMYLISALKR